METLGTVPMTGRGSGLGCLPRPPPGGNFLRRWWWWCWWWWQCGLPGVGWTDAAGARAPALARGPRGHRQPPASAEEAAPVKCAENYYYHHHHHHHYHYHYYY